MPFSIFIYFFKWSRSSP